VIIPEKVVDQIKANGKAKGETLRTTVLRALKKAGYEVTDDDLVDRRVQAGKERADAYYCGRS
jgi:hypothetical protein